MSISRYAPERLKQPFTDCFSFTLTYVRAYTGKLLPSFVIHLVFNGVQSLIIALAPFLGWGSS